MKIKNPVSESIRKLWKSSIRLVGRWKFLIFDSHSSRKSSNHNDGERLLAWQLSRRHTLTPSKWRVNHIRPLLKELAVCRVRYQNIFMESWREGKCLVGKGAKARGMTAAPRELWSKSDSRTCRSFARSWMEARLGASRASTHRHVQEMRYKRCILSVGPLH